MTTLDSNTIVSYILKNVFFPKTDPVELRDPCFHPGYNVTKTFESVFDTPCMMNTGNLSNGNFYHVGLGNWSLCQQSIRKVFNTNNCPYSKCSFNDVFQPSVDGKFGVRNKDDCLNEFISLVVNQN